jgi:cytochrome b involved in lipid metabolism
MTSLVRSFIPYPPGTSAKPFIGYVDYHPAGFEIMKAVAGHDATSEFARYHSQALLNESDYAALKIGRVVPEVELADLRANEIVLHEWVFDTTSTFSPSYHLLPFN